MTARLKVILAVTSVAALTFVGKAAQRWRRSPVSSPDAPDQFSGADVTAEEHSPATFPNLDIDDDTAADIIRRARPALELARHVKE